jgi:hypothetical protein
MLGKTLGFLLSKIWTMSNGQLDKQPLGGQYNQNPQNKLSHASYGTYPKPLSGPPSTMHRQVKGCKNIRWGEHFMDANSKA